MQPKRLSYFKGIFAEFHCVLFLLIKGYSILARRYKTPQGEIDIIAIKGKAIVFVEVKARNNEADALASITSQKRHRTQRAALAFVASHPQFIHHDLRFDVMVVTSRFRIIHLVNAWSAA